MPDEHYDFTPAPLLMQADEIIALAKLFVAHGVKKIRLTGGEPLVRKDAAAIISALGQLPVELVMTTNGSRIREMMPVLAEAGIRTINVSLDTLQEEKFLLATRSKVYKRVRENIDLLLDQGIAVKINTVVMKGFNEAEINDFIAWTKLTPVEIRFIEFMPFSDNRWRSDRVFSHQEILGSIGRAYTYRSIEPRLNETARRFEVPGHQGSFAIIGTMTAPFCSTCNRMRLTADGKLKNCLFSTGETDLLQALRAGEDVLPLIESCIRQKKEALGGQLDQHFEQLDAGLLKNRSMITIGG